MSDKRITLTLYTGLLFDVCADHITAVVPRKEDTYEKRRWFSFSKPKLKTTKIGATVAFTNGEVYDVMETLSQIREMLT